MQMEACPVEAHGIDTTPEITISLLSGATVWGPRRVDLRQTAGQLAHCIERPIGCPGVKLVHGSEVLNDDVDVSRLPDPAQLMVSFLAPRPFDHSFVSALLELDGIHDGFNLLPLSQLAPEAFTVPDAEVLRAEIIANTCDQSSNQYGWNSAWKICLQLRFPADLNPKKQSLLTSYGFSTKRRRYANKSTVVVQWDGASFLDSTLSGGDGEIMESGPAGTIVKCDAFLEEDVLEDWDHDNHVVWTPVDGLVAEHAAKRIFEGISYSSGQVSADLMQRLNCLIDSLKASEHVDYHPGSNDIVRDLVHPSLYPFIKGLSSFSSDLTPEEADASFQGEMDRDMWNRPYEESKFQWLPAEVSVSEHGRCQFQSYINNLPKEKYSELYTALEDLLTKCLPHLEAVWSHGASIQFHGENMIHLRRDAEDEVNEKSLRDRTLQVIVKIVDYEFAPGQTHEGVWHVEGMSHENIVATAELVLQKAASLERGNLEFQRAWTTDEAGCFFFILAPPAPPSSRRCMHTEGPLPTWSAATGARPAHCMAQQPCS